MESHRIWIANLQDMLMNHVCQGLLKTYSEILRLCGGHKIKFSIQTAMEGISHLTSHKINADYRILIESLGKIGYTEKNLNDLLMNAYSSYALSALKSAGISCEKLDQSLLTGPKGSAFIHEIYINVARNLWMRPDVLVDQNVPQLKAYVKEGVEQAVRSGVNLNAIAAALSEVKSGGAAPESRPKAVAKPTIKERLNMINGGRTLLDDDGSDDESVAEHQPSEASVKRSVHADSMPSFTDEPASELMTIDDDDFAPDNMTITFDPTETEDATEDEVSTENQPETLNVNVKEKKEYELSLEGESSGASIGKSIASVPETTPTMSNPASAISQRDKGDDLVIDLTPGTATGGSMEKEVDEVSAYTVFTVLPSELKLKQLKQEQQLKLKLQPEPEPEPEQKLKLKLKLQPEPEVALKPKTQLQQTQESTRVEDIPDFLVTDIVNMDASDEASQYTITLLSHSDMLSSRLSRLGVK